MHFYHLLKTCWMFEYIRCYCFRKSFHSERNNMNAYIVFKSKEDADKAMTWYISLVKVTFFCFSYDLYLHYCIDRESLPPSKI